MRLFCNRLTLHMPESSWTGRVGDLCDWRNAIAAKDLEIQNLQVTWILNPFRNKAAMSKCWLFAFDTWLPDAEQPLDPPRICALQFLTLCRLL